MRAMLAASHFMSAFSVILFFYFYDVHCLWLYLNVLKSGCKSYVADTAQMWIFMSVETLRKDKYFI